MELHNAVERELLGEGVCVPVTPEKAIEARPGLDSSSRILKGHLGPSGSPRRLQEAGNHRMDNQSERYTCLGYCSSSGEMEGRKGGESTNDGVERSFDLAGGVDSNSFMELLVLSNASSSACEASGISTSECVVGDSSMNIPGNLEKTGTLSSIAHSQACHSGTP